jgi:hypothetical protein
MKKALLGLLAAALIAGSYLLGTFNARKVISIPPAGWTEENEAAASWRELAASLESAGARVFAATDDPAERLEGLRYLAQLVSAALEMKLAKGSVQAPRFTDWMRDYRKFLGDSPDAVYHTAQLSPENEYEISGNRGDAEYLGFMLYGTGINGWNRAAANLSSESMTFDPEGNFRILISPRQPATGDADWLPLESDAHMVMARQYFHGREGKATARFTIRNLDGTGVPPAAESDVAGGLVEAARFFNDTLDGAIALGELLSGSPNQIDPPAGYNPDFGGVFYPTLDNAYFGGWFRLEEEEALVVEGAVPDAPYWSLSLQNRWMQSLDYRHHPVALNDRAIRSEGGRYRVIVSHRRPPSGNWLSTAGRREGLLAIRYQLSQDAEAPSMKVVPFDAL